MPTRFLRRVLTSVPLLFVVTFLSFALNSFLPGDAAQTMMQGEGTRAEYLAVRAELGLDQPLLVQYVHWLSRALHGDLGTSFFTNESVVSLLNQRVGVTLSILAGVMLVSVSAGLWLGVASAVRRGRVGAAIDVISLTGMMFPSFWVALVLMSIFAVWLQWLPATGYSPLSQGLGSWLACLALPVLSVSLHAVTGIAKQTRDAMRDVLDRDFIRALRASGLSERVIFWKHALRNAALPVVTMIGLVMVSAIGGTVFVERVFVLPGLGSLAVTAAQQGDIPLLQGATLYFTALTIAINLVVDLSYGWLNPKLRR